MNNFKMNLRVNNRRAIDKTIQNEVNEEIENLEATVDKKIVKYCEQIHDRKKGIRDVLNDFDYNMSVIEERKRYGINSTKREELSVESIIDGIIKKQITKRLESMYQGIIKNQGENNCMEINEAVTQVLDRQLRIGMLLEEYDQNMEILHRYNPNKQSKVDKTEEITTNRDEI